VVLNPSSGVISGTPTTAGTYNFSTTVRDATGTTSVPTSYSLTIENSSDSGGCLAGGQPSVTLNTPAAGANRLSGHACNVDPAKIKVVIYVLTNQWYVQPLANAPFTTIAMDGSWSNSTNGWSSIVVLLVDPANYTPAATAITNPALDRGVLAWAEYPQGPIRVSFSGYTWGIKVTGNNNSSYSFDPGPNFWSNDTSVVQVATDGLHLRNVQFNGNWQSGEVYLTESLGYGTYTVQVASRLDQLGLNTVAAPLFLYTAPGQELDNEYSGVGGLIPSPYSSQFVVQPYTTAGNIVRYLQPAAAQFTSQIEWRADHITFRAWYGWSSVPAPGDVIYQWTRPGAPLPAPGNERVHINLWLLNGRPPASGIGDTMIIKSFTFHSGSGAVPSITSVAPVDSTVSIIQPGEWVSIYGANLADSTVNWSEDFPTSLGGTSVTIDGKAAYLSLVSPTQINLQAPDDATIGPVPVVVNTVGGTASTNVTLAQYAPSFLLLDNEHPAGIIQRSDGSGAYGDYDILGPTGMSLGYPTVAAKEGDHISLFAVGFGPTNPVVRPGQPFSGAAPATNSVNILINHVSVPVSFAGLSGAGLYQINLTVPAGLGTGDVPLAASVGGIQTPPSVVISLK
jgi:uncharacterized protein (TIGR03437 family)